MPHLQQNIDLKLPIAKYRDSVVIWRNESFVEIIINRIESIRDNEDKWVWLYYDTDEGGLTDALTEFDILMNITTGKNFMMERATQEAIRKHFIQ